MSNTPYDDIINLPHHVSKNHTPMPRESRAAQFAPFAALTGYDASVREEARLTGKRLELTDEQIDMLNDKMSLLTKKIKERPSIRVVYFLPDERKEGGSYVSVCGNLSHIDTAQGVLIFSDKRKIYLPDILDIEGDIFNRSTPDGV